VAKNTRVLKGISKFHPTTGHAGPERSFRRSSTLSLTSALDGGSGQLQSPAALTPRKRIGTHFIRGWVDPGAGLYGCGKSRPLSFRFPDIDISTTLSRLTESKKSFFNLDMAFTIPKCHLTENSSLDILRGNAYLM
jgi:hypothetical protein